MILSPKSKRQISIVKDKRRTDGVDARFAREEMEDGA